MQPLKRRYRRHRPAGKLHPLAIVGIVALGVILLTVLIGNLLRLWLDDETYFRLTKGDEPAPQAPPAVQISVPDVNAYPFSFGDDLNDALNVPAVSVSLNLPSGSLLYRSEVSELLGTPFESELSLQQTMQELTAYSPYVSGVFYPQALYYEDENARFAVTAAESALLREFLSLGGKDAVLLDIPFSRCTNEELTEYLRTVKAAVGDAALGVAVPFYVATATDGWETLGILLSACDFCLLDVRTAPSHADGTPMSVEELLTEADYLFKQYGMRLLLSDLQIELQREIELRMLADFQIVTTPPAPKDE